MAWKSLTKKEKGVLDVLLDVYIDAEVLRKISELSKTKQWEEGFVWGMKHAVIRTLELHNDEAIEEVFKYVVNWKAEKKKLEKQLIKDGELIKFKALGKALKKFYQKLSSPEFLSMLKNQIENKPHALSPVEEHVLQKRYGLEENQIFSLEQIGDSLKMDADRVQKIELEALYKLGLLPSKKKTKS
jgi:DNA-directed RNA polymerase sigma subunit (sigma70/sigma32)